jgi:hypothetical protein
VVRYGIFQAQLAKLPIGQINLNLAANPITGHRLPRLAERKL